MKKYLKLDTKERSLIKKKGMIRWYGWRKHGSGSQDESICFVFNFDLQHTVIHMLLFSYFIKESTALALAKLYNDEIV